MDTVLAKLRQSYPFITFEEGAVFSWMPRRKAVVYRPFKDVPEEEAIVMQWSLLHEVGHAVLEHHTFRYDFELLKMEMAAWQKAKELAKKFGVAIEEDHIQDCLDTYRDWLYQRSTCPECLTCSTQPSPRTYRCHNCGTEWRVSSSRHCRPYRRVALRHAKS